MRDVSALVALEGVFVVLPVAVKGAAGAAILSILHVEDGDVGAVEHAFAFVFHVSEFDARALLPG